MGQAAAASTCTSGKIQVVYNLGDSGEIHKRAKIASRREGANFRRASRVASPRNFARTCIFARPTTVIAKIRDYSQSSKYGKR